MKTARNDDHIFALRVRKPNRIFTVLISLLMVGLLGALDYLSGYDVSFSIFYLIPITLSVLLSDLRTSLFVSLASAVSWYLADAYSGHVYGNSLIPIWNSFMRFGYFLIHSALLHRFLKIYNMVKTDSVTDSLTGAVNSKYFHEMFGRELNISRRTQKAFTIVYFDLDNFKYVNDNFGHLAGDSLLKKLSDTIQANIRPSDIFARMGGDEFILLLINADYTLSEEVVARIRDILKKEFTHMNWPVTLSGGGITFTKFQYSIEDMIRQADALMYEVKKEGKDNFKHVSSEDGQG